MNVVTLIGNLATDVELREVGEDKRVASFVLAIDRPGRDGRLGLVGAVRQQDEHGEAQQDHQQHCLDPALGQQKRPTTRTLHPCSSPFAPTRLCRTAQCIHPARDVFTPKP